MKIHKGDTVKMLSGKDKGKTGKVLHALPQDKKIIVEGLNLVKRHTRPRQQGQKGQVVSKPRAVNVSSAMLICVKCGKSSRVRHEKREGKKTRLCKKCGGEN